jgi:hypothetical protein
MAIDYRSEYPQVTEEARRRLQLIEQTQGPAQVKAEIDRLNGSGNRRPAATTNLSDLTIDSPNLMSNWRKRNIPRTTPEARQPAPPVQFGTGNGGGTDWRVKISNPFGAVGPLAPLGKTGGLMFPIQPQITMNGQANYDDVAPIHNNYPFPAYQNSQPGSITIVGEFPVESPEDADYWVAATHFLRSATKMYYGNTSNKGAPPPIVKLNGYGNYVMKNIPCVVEQFTTDLPNQVDYIRSTGGNYVPADSTINVVLKPIYSRNKVEQFSLDSFVSGGLISQGYI